jgi:hypothetical protein
VVATEERLTTTDTDSVEDIYVRVKLRVRRGRHRVVVTAVDAAGNRSAAKRIRFRAR